MAHFAREMGMVVVRILATTAPVERKILGIAAAEIYSQRK
jgi:hypothetical protein